MFNQKDMLRLLSQIKNAYVINNHIEPEKSELDNPGTAIMLTKEKEGE
jgi:hypothetical protein